MRGCWGRFGGCSGRYESQGMRAHFEELDYRPTPLGDLVLRRRTDPSLGVEIYEIKLGDEFLMSSLFTEGETALARIALEELGEGELDVVVGGLGLGYTARSVLKHPRVRSLQVVEALSPVIEWHERGLLPLGACLVSDSRCRFVHGDFFAMFAAAPRDPHARFHAILVDIDHSPRHALDPGHARFYELEGLRRLAAHLHTGGVFALWSNDPPDVAFNETLAQAFEATEAHVVTFHNPLQDRDACNTIYVARRGPG